MCGIHGFITGATRQTKADEFMIMSYTANSLRGTDASGIASIDVVTRTVYSTKLPCPGFYFMQNGYAKSLARAANSVNTITIGHTRSSTSGDRGGVSDAHPFSIHDVIGDREMVGVHNGTLYPWKTKVNASRYSVDSEWALNHIFDNGMAAFKDFEGSYCFVWWDNVDPNILNMALNKERPMHIAMTEDGGMAYASEAGMLAWMLEKSQIKRTTEIKRLVPGHWYKFDIKALTEYTKEEIPSPPVAVTTPRNQYNGFTTIDHVDAFLDRVGAPVVSILPDETGKAKLVKPEDRRQLSTREEVENAKMMHMLGDEGCFQPWWDDKDEISGTWTGRDGVECTAIIRYSDHLTYNSDTMWVVKCIGIQDDGKSDITVVCSRPLRTLIPTEPTSDAITTH